MHSNFFYAIVVQGLFSTTIPQTPSLILSSVAYLLPTILNPRFILSIRELSAQNIHGSDIDTGFGMGHIVSTIINIGTTIHFADPLLGVGSVEVEEIPMEAQRAKR